jgi:hypothetical protein
MCAHTKKTQHKVRILFNVSFCIFQLLSDPLKRRVSFQLMSLKEEVATMEIVWYFGSHTSDFYLIIVVSLLIIYCVTSADCLKCSYVYQIAFLTLESDDNCKRVASLNWGEVYWACERWHKNALILSLDLISDKFIKNILKILLITSQDEWLQNYVFPFLIAKIVS